MNPAYHWLNKTVAGDFIILYRTQQTFQQPPVKTSNENKNEIRPD